MREIKFRAWLENTMIYGDPSYIWDMTTEGDPKMQYIGLKDRYDKEIYVSDIVKVSYDYGTGEHPEGDTIHEVVETIEGFDLSPRAVKHLARIWMDSELDFRIEVIGNIYDTPELLNKDGN